MSALQGFQIFWLDILSDKALKHFCHLMGLPIPLGLALP